MGDVRLLDCTLRDGGYYNDWDFAFATCERYVRAMERARIRLVELGFRTLDTESWFGAAAYTTEDFLDRLRPSPEMLVGVMVNAKEVVGHAAGSRAAIDRLFGESKDSRVDLVRIATTSAEVPGLDGAIEGLKDKGYQVGVNMMRSHMLGLEDVEEFGRWCRERSADVAYFADSLGCLRPDDVDRIARALLQGFEGEIGCHLHDNMALAMGNSLAAIDAGVTWVDGTIRGMGRGPGNTRTEYLAMEFLDRKLADVDPQGLIGIVEGDFLELQQKYGWGTSIFYYQSALDHVHPTPVQQLLQDGRNSADRILQSISELSEPGTSTDDADKEPAWVGQQLDPSELLDGREVLILGGGSSVGAHSEAIAGLIDRLNPFVLQLNLAPSIDSRLIDGFVALRSYRAVVDVDLLPPDVSAVIVSREVARSVDFGEHGGKVRTYDAVVSPDASLSCNAEGCHIPYPTTAAFAFAMALAGGATRVLCAGLDGFDGHDPRQAQMLGAIEAVKSIAADSVPIVSLTPTSYPIREVSVYAPVWV